MPPKLFVYKLTELRAVVIKESFKSATCMLTIFIVFSKQKNVWGVVGDKITSQDMKQVI